LEYHIFVRHSILASVAVFGLLALSVILVSTSHAQINGAPASVTSPGFGGHAVNGTPSSVTSLGPSGYTPNSRVTFSGAGGNNGGGHHHHYVQYAPPVIYAVPMPYAVDIGATDPDNYDDTSEGVNDRDADYQGGPTIFDRRGSGANSYIPPVRDLSEPRDYQRAVSEPEVPEPPQEPTLLIFKDGHKVEVGNYAIIGATLFDLTPGHSRKVALADLDLDATRKQNDDRGITFQLPPSPQVD
jgi:hypothetical protein